MLQVDGNVDNRPRGISAMTREKALIEDFQPAGRTRYAYRNRRSDRMRKDDIYQPPDALL